MYFIMDCDEPLNDNGEALLEIHNCFRVGGIRNWRGGRPFQTDPAAVPKPIAIDWDPLRGYRGPPVEFRDVCIPIMSARLAAALEGAGVDNIAFFETELTNTVTGEKSDYRAFNVIGTVAAANLDESEHTSHDQPVVDVSIMDLVFDETRTGGLLLFRLAENINAIFVHERVKDHVERSGIDTMRFVRPEDWMHL